MPERETILIQVAALVAYNYEPGTLREFINFYILNYSRIVKTCGNRFDLVTNFHVDPKY